MNGDRLKSGVDDLDMRMQNSSKTNLLLSLAGRSFRLLVDISGKAIY